ncbi:MAG: PEP-CTERM sorting domain-containing protein [Planctomycetota bacterium]
MVRMVLLLSMALVSASANHASGAIVLFSGSLFSGSGSALGDVPPELDFTFSLDFTETSPGFASIDSGIFSTALGDIPVVGGDILLLDNGSNDQAIFAIDTSSPAGAFSANFAGDAIFDNLVTSANLASIINAAAPTTISADFGAAGNYTGRVTSASVPEPSGLIGLTVGALATIWRRRRG